MEKLWKKLFQSTTREEPADRMTLTGGRKKVGLPKFDGGIEKTF